METRSPGDAAQCENGGLIEGILLHHVPQSDPPDTPAEALYAGGVAAEIGKDQEDRLANGAAITTEITIKSTDDLGDTGSIYLTREVGLIFLYIIQQISFARYLRLIVGL
jgi:hypothetical protein